METNNIVQVLLSIFSLCSLFCITRDKENVRKYAPIFGLLSQPFWIYSTYCASQFGMFILSFIYTLIWISTLIKMWFK